MSGPIYDLQFTIHGLEAELCKQGVFGLARSRLVGEAEEQMVK